MSQTRENAEQKTVISLGNVRTAEGHDEAIIDFVDELGYPGISLTEKIIGGVACKRIEVSPPMTREHLEDIGQYCSELAAGRDHEIAVSNSTVIMMAY